MDWKDLLFPRRCVSCGKRGNYICGVCRSRISYTKEQICPVCAKMSVDGMTHFRCRGRYSLDGLFSACRYKGPIKNSVHILKYRYVSDLGKELSQLIASCFQLKLNFDFILPVPLSSTRKRERGFNQAEVIAYGLSEIWSLPLGNRMLFRTKNTLPQADLKIEERRENIKGAFFAGEGIKNKRIALIDDVSTTRFTLTEAGKTLKRAGASFVFGIVLAHG